MHLIIVGLTAFYKHLDAWKCFTIKLSGLYGGIKKNAKSFEKAHVKVLFDKR